MKKCICDNNNNNFVIVQYIHFIYILYIYILENMGICLQIDKTCFIKNSIC